MSVLGFDAGKATQAGTAYQIKQQSLNGVIAMVCNADGACSALLHDPFKVCVSEFTGCHLNGDAFLLGVRCGVIVADN